MADADPQKDQPIDLSSLDGLTLGTAWTPASSSPSRESSDRPRRERSSFGDRRDSRLPRRDHFGPAASQSRRGFGDRRGSDSDRHVTFAPQPPTLEVVFYPEEAPFKALTKAIKASKRTYELFEISRLILEKPERVVVTVSNKPTVPEGKPAPLFLSIADGAVFMTEAEALQHACSSSLEKFFKAEEVEVEAPKGNFVVIHRCGITGKLIAPPNFHRYAALLSEHQARYLPKMALSAIQARLETIKDPEVIAEWLVGQKKTMRYTLLVPQAPESTPGTPTATDTPSFEGAEAAASYLATHHKADLIKAVSQARLNHKQISALPKGEVLRSIEAARQIQLKFPLLTANSLRGRFRRMGFNLYKRGQKGVSYLSAVKRKFRVIGQTFAPEVQQVIEFIEKTPNVSDSELPKQMLGINVPVVAPQSLSAPLAVQVPAEAPVAPVPQPSTLLPEEDAALRKLRQTLQWLVEEGYVVHFGNGKLFVPPARSPNAPKADDEEESAEAATEPAAEPVEAPAEPSADPTQILPPDGDSKA